MRAMLKYFFAVLYMAIGLNAFAQQPVFYGFATYPNPDSSGLPITFFSKYDHKTDNATPLNLSSAIKADYTFSNIYNKNITAFDPFNGRYFIVGEVYANPLVITEINVESGLVKEYLLPPGFNDLDNLQYNSKNNSLVFTSDNKNIYYLYEFYLTSNVLREFFTFEGNTVDDRSSFLSFNWKTQELAFSYRYDKYNGCVLHKIDVEKGSISDSFFVTTATSFLPVWNVETNDLLIRIGQNKGYFCYYNQGKIDTLFEDFSWSLRKPSRYYFSQFNKKHLYLRTENRLTLYDFDLSNFFIKTVYPTARLWGLIQLHTYEQPYIYTSENAYRSTYGKSYVWLWNEKPIENSNSQEWKPTKCGNYKVVVTHLDGRIDTSEAVEYKATDSKGYQINKTASFAYPNPFENVLNIRYKTCTDDAVTIKIYNSIGAEILTANLGNIEAGEHIYNWDSRLNGLRYGLYFVHVYSGNELLSTQKVFKR